MTTPYRTGEDGLCPPVTQERVLCRGCSRRLCHCHGSAALCGRCANTARRTHVTVVGVCVFAVVGSLLSIPLFGAIAIARAAHAIAVVPGVRLGPRAIEHLRHPRAPRLPLAFAMPVAPTPQPATEPTTARVAVNIDAPPTYLRDARTASPPTLLSDVAHSTSPFALRMAAARLERAGSDIVLDDVRLPRGAPEAFYAWTARCSEHTSFSPRAMRSALAAVEINVHGSDCATSIPVLRDRDIVLAVNGRAAGSQRRLPWLAAERMIVFELMRGGRYVVVTARW